MTTELGSLEKEAYHIVCDATGVTAVIEMTMDYVRPSGKILWFAVPHKDAVAKIPLFRMFEKEISIYSSYTSLRNSWQAIHLLQSKRIRVDKLISHKLPLEELETGLKIIETHSEPAMKILCIPRES